MRRLRRVPATGGRHPASYTPGAATSGPAREHLDLDTVPVVSTEARVALAKARRDALARQRLPKRSK